MAAALANAVRRKPADILLAAEAVTLLALFRISLRLFPVRRILQAISRSTAPAKPDAPTSPDPTTLATAIRVRWALESATRNAPARFVCFPQTLAGYTMLRRRKIPSTMVYGVARSPQGALTAHTWLTLGDRIVLGGEGSEAFSPIERWT